MTNITELAQSLKRRAASANEFGEGLFFIKADDVLALVEALENSESRLHEVAVACATAEQALEKAQQQTTESENRVRKQNRHICELFDDNTALRQRIAGLESRTVTVKLPDINEYLAEVHDKTLNRAFRLLAEGVRAGDVAAMRAAGIKVEAE